jgi:hypothetical protein
VTSHAAIGCREGFAKLMAQTKLGQNVRHQTDTFPNCNRRMQVSLPSLLAASGLYINQCLLFLLQYDCPAISKPLGFQSRSLSHTQEGGRSSGVSCVSCANQTNPAPKSVVAYIRERWMKLGSSEVADIPRFRRRDTLRSGPASFSRSRRRHHAFSTPATRAACDPGTRRRYYDIH